MHDSRHDADKDVLCRLTPCAGRGCDQEDIGEGVPQFIRPRVLVALSNSLSHTAVSMAL